MWKLSSANERIRVRSFASVRSAASVTLLVAGSTMACGPSTFRLRPASEESLPVVARPVTVSRKPIEAGAVTLTSETVSVELRLTVRAPGKPTQAVDMAVGSRVTKEETALAVKGGVATELRVSYAEASTDLRVGSKSSRSESPLARHTYLLRVVGGSIDALRPDGTAPSTVETKALRLEYRSLTPKAKVSSTGPASTKPSEPTPIAIGERLPEWEARFGALFGGDAASGVKVSDIEVTLLGVAEGATDKAVFQIGVSTDVDTKESLPLHMHTLLRGRWTIGTDTGWAERLVLGGPTSVRATRADSTIEGSGTTRIETTWRHVQPASDGK